MAISLGAAKDYGYPKMAISLGTLAETIGKHRGTEAKRKQRKEFIPCIARLKKT